MKKFLVHFKEQKKNFTIQAQDDKQAQLWADKQLEHWKKEGKYTVTPIVSQNKV